MRQYINKYDDYLVLNAINCIYLFEAKKENKFLNAINAVRMKFSKTAQAKDALSKYDPVLMNKMEQYEKNIDAHLDKKELKDLWKTFGNDQVIASYVNKINNTSDFKEKEILMKKADEYILSKLTKRQSEIIKNINFKTNTEGKVTPQMVQEVFQIINTFKTDINKYLKSINLPLIDDIDIGGSAKNWQKDIKSNPDITYGDVDVIIIYPLIPSYGGPDSHHNDEEESGRIYTRLVLDWIMENKPKYINDIATLHINRSNFNRKLFNPGFNIVFKLKDGQEISSDVIVSYGPYKMWTFNRFGTDKEHKGLIFGNLYNAISNILLIDIGTTGVNAWTTKRGQKLRSKSDTGAKTIHKISTNNKTFLLDIAYWFGEFIGLNKNVMKIDPLLKRNSGIKGNPNLQNILLGVKGLFKTLEINGIYEKGIIPNANNSRFLLQDLYNRYINRLNNAVYGVQDDYALYQNYTYKSNGKGKTTEEYIKLRKSIDYAKELSKKILLKG